MPPYALLADAVVLLHLGFILFVLLGGLLALHWPKAPWLHLPATAWAVVVELCGLGCPLTPLEHRFRTLAGESGYSGGFIQHNLLPLIYPGELTRGIQVTLALLVIMVNLGIYWRIRRRIGRKRR